jgi:TPR repeat protein
MHGRSGSLATRVVGCLIVLGIRALSADSLDVAGTRKACDAGSAPACLVLAFLYEEGKGVAKDLAMAAALFEKACNGGEAYGCSRLASLHRDGTGVAKDLVRAATLYGKACDAREASACAFLGALVEEGSGVKQDPARAAQLYKKGCDGGSAYGCSRLARAYELGIGVPQDAAHAAALYKKSCDADDLYDCWKLAALYEEGNGVGMDPARAAALYEKACTDDYLYGCGDLARLYLEGTGVRKDPARAGALFRRSCDGGGVGCEYIEAWRLEELRLVALARRDGGSSVGYLLNGRGSVWPVKPGDRVLDGAIESVGADSVSAKMDASRAKGTRRIFEGEKPPPWTPDPKFDGAPIDVDFAGDIKSFAALLADVSGLNVILQAGLSGTVKVAGRQAPWDAVAARAVAAAGFGYRVGHSVVFIARADGLPKLRLPEARPGSGHPISLAIRSGDMEDIGRLFADITGVTVVTPDAECKDVAIFVRDMPWDEALGWITASCGWTYRADAERIRIEAAR